MVTNQYLQDLAMISEEKAIKFTGQEEVTQSLHFVIVMILSKRHKSFLFNINTGFKYILHCKATVYFSKNAIMFFNESCFFKLSTTACPLITSQSIRCSITIRLCKAGDRASRWSAFCTR